MCHATRTAGQTLKEKENYFWCFFQKISVTRCERPDRHNEVKENVFIIFFDFLYFFLQIFYNFQIYLFFLIRINK